MDFPSSNIMASELIMPPDVLRGCAPVHPAVMRRANYSAQFHDQWHQRVAASRDTFPNPIEIQPIDSAARSDGLRRLEGNDAEFCLGLRERCLDIHPRLPSLPGVEPFADARRRHPGCGKALTRRPDLHVKQR